MRPHPRAAALFVDVEKLALEGRPVPVAPSSWTKVAYARRQFRDLGLKAAARLDRNKRNFALFAATTTTTTIAAVAVAAATGPGAAGIPVAIVSTVAVATVTAGVTIAVGRVWRFAKAAVHLKVKIKGWDARNDAAGKAEAGLGKGQVRDADDFIAVDPHYAEILDSVSYMLQYDGLSAIQDAFTIMEREFATAERRMLASPEIRDCADALRLWEALARVRYEFDRVRNIFELFDAFVVWLVMDRSRMEEEFRTAFEGTWPKFVAATDFTRLGLLNDAANGSAVFHTRLRDLGRRVDYTAFIFDALPPAAHADLALSTPEGAAAGGAGAARRIVGAGVKGAAVGAVKSSLSGGISLGGKVAYSAVATAVSTAPTTVAAEVAKTATTGAVSLGAGVATGVFNTALTAVVQETNAVWNDYKLKNKKTLGLKGLREQTIIERIATLRTEVKQKKLAKFVTKWKHLRQSHDLFVRQSMGDPSDYATRLLRRQKHWFQTLGEDQLGKYVFEFHETVVMAANTMSTQVDLWAEEMAPRIDAWIRSHEAHAICGGYCYNTRAVVPAGMPAHGAEVEADAIPVRPIGAKVRPEKAPG